MLRSLAVAEQHDVRGVERDRYVRGRGGGVDRRVVRDRPVKGVRCAVDQGTDDGRAVEVVRKQRAERSARGEPLAWPEGYEPDRERERTHSHGHGPVPAPLPLCPEGPGDALSRSKAHYDKGEYELALACDEIVLVEDGSSAVSLPEVPLLGVLPGTGGLTRVVDKRKVRRDLADVFSTVSEGIKGKRAVEWRLVDYSVPRSKFDFAEMRAALWDAKWELALPIVVLVGLRFAGPLGAASFTAFYVFVIEVFVYRDLSLGTDIPRIIPDSMVLVGAIFVKLCAATVLTFYFVQAQTADHLFEALFFARIIEIHADIRAAAFKVG